MGARVLAGHTECCNTMQPLFSPAVLRISYMGIATRPVPAPPSPPSIPCPTGGWGGGGGGGLWLVLNILARCVGVLYGYRDCGMCCKALAGRNYTWEEGQLDRVGIHVHQVHCYRLHCEAVEQARKDSPRHGTCHAYTPFLSFLILSVSRS